MSRYMLSASMLIPRIIALVLLPVGWFQGVFGWMLVPVLGILVLPVTTIWYGAIHHWFNGEWNVVTLGGLLIAALIDIGPAAAQRKTRVARV